jgi:hypothetical protein
LNYGDPNDLDILCDRAESYILNEQFDKGLYLVGVNIHLLLCFSRGRLSEGGKCSRRITQGKGGIEQSAEIVETEPKEGLLQDFGRPTVIQICQKLIYSNLEMRTSVKLRKRTENWLKSGTRTTSKPKRFEFVCMLN